MAHLINTKSIDVGSMFLMDLSVHESDLNETNTSTSTIIDTDLVFPKTNFSSPASNNQIIEMKNSPTTHDHLNSTSGYDQNDISKINQKETMQPLSHERIAYRRSTQCDYLGNSLDRLASAINKSPNDDGLLDQNPFRNNTSDDFDQTNEKDGKISQVTVVEPQPPPELENQFSSASSLSDESFVASTGSATSYTASCESVGGDDDHGSTTTREDSGVLDIKDLGNQLSHSYDNEHEENVCQQQRFDRNQEKAISNNVMATNLINKSANNNEQNNSALMQQQQNYSNWPNNSMNNKPTNNHHNHHNNYYHNNNNNRHHRNHSHRNTSFSQPQRSMSASLPIEVPPRQMKKELKKSKRDYKNQIDNKVQEVKNSNMATNTNRTNIDDVLDDDFLEQEYNENHHNHYPIDEFDEEPLRAEENPMKLFESIQALARSLHEDAELFGSLPPKRMLESPIRSLIFS